MADDRRRTPSVLIWTFGSGEQKIEKSGRYRNLQIFFFSFPKIVSQNVIKIATCRYIDTCQLLYLLREFLLWLTDDIPSLGIKKRIKRPPPYIKLVIMPARLISGSLGGKVLIHQGFKYKKNIIRRHIVYWRCWKKECRAPLKTNLFDLEDQIANSNVLSESEHTHAHEDVQITRSEIKNRLVQKV